VKTRTEMCAAFFVMLLMGGSFESAGRSTAHFNNLGSTVELSTGAVVATGLDNPRGLDWSNGRLFIAEAGTGGDGSCVPGIFASEICLGRTGSVTVVTRTGHQRRIVEGLPSLAGPDGTFAYGPSDVSVNDGHVYVSIGGPNETRNRELLTEAIARKLGTVQLLFGRRSITVGEISEFVARNDPDGPPEETNPTASSPGGALCTPSTPEAMRSSASIGAAGSSSSTSSTTSRCPTARRSTRFRRTWCSAPMAPCT